MPYKKYDERYKFTGKERDRETGYDFFGASNLEAISIPQNVSTTDLAAFACPNLKEIYSYAKSPQTIMQRMTPDDEQLYSAFFNVNTDSCVLYVPEKSMESYETAEGWKEFGTVVEITAR